jgi:hypothetical protein
LKKRCIVVEAKLLRAGWIGSDAVCLALLNAMAERSQAKGDIGGAAIAAINQIRADGIEPSSACYEVAVELVSRSAAGRHRPWSSAELARLQFAVPRHLPETYVGDGVVASDGAVVTTNRKHKAWDAVTRIAWSSVANAVGSGRSAWQCRQKWEVVRRAGTPVWSTSLPRGAVRNAYGKDSKRSSNEGFVDTDLPARQQFWGLKMAVNMLERMVHGGLSPSLELCNLVLARCARSNVPWLSLSLLQNMKRWDITPDGDSLHLVLQV